MNRLLRGCLWLLLLATACRSAPGSAAEPWVPSATPTRQSLRGLAVVDADVVWVGGAGGTLLRTLDGGASWQDVRPRDAADCDFRDVQAFSADVALAMVAGQPARLYRTEDGGRRWTIVHESHHPDAFFDAVAFAGDDGVLFGDPVDGAFDVWVSRDAGRSWSLLPRARLPAPVAGEAAFAASGTCAAVVVGPDAVPCALVVTGGSTTRCLHLPFDGSAPRVQPLPLPHGVASRGAFAIAQRGWRAVVVGGDYAVPEWSAVAACSEDAGATFGASATAVGGYRSAVVWLDDDRLLAVGSHGQSASCDGGRTWRPFGSAGYHSVAVGADGSVWACGSEGRVARLDLRRFPPDPARPPR